MKLLSYVMLGILMLAFVSAFGINNPVLPKISRAVTAINNTDYFNGYTTETLANHYQDTRGWGNCTATNTTTLSYYFFISTQNSFTMPDKNQWYNYSWNSTASLNSGFTFSDYTITITNAGKYKINWNMNGWTNSGLPHSLVTRMLKNNVEVEGSYMAQALLGGYNGVITNSVIIDASANDEIIIQTGGSIANSTISRYDSTDLPDAVSSTVANLNIQSI